ncbi:hypothetical protein ACMDCR_00440 [Labrys okinawensis]|uniref:hypothetical protein n=1 Tax=Labrys okinawensis TaxID=346911 RepID=UPI0039BC4AD0
MAAPIVHISDEAEDWQLVEIEAALAEADQADFASEAEIDAVIARYVRPEQE